MIATHFLKTLKSPKTLFQSAITVALAAAFILLMPLLAMQFSDEVTWTASDFAIAWILLFSAGFAYTLVARKMGSVRYRAAIVASIGTGLFLLWSNLAVGLIGSEENPANLMYLGVLSIALIGALLARFQPRGMIITLLATALAQALVTAIALITGQQHLPESSVPEILTVNWFFIVLWIVSAILFRNADLDQKASVNK
jgi:hypothetical protein